MERNHCVWQIEGQSVVLVMLNFYTYKEEIKRAILVRKAALDVSLHLLDWAWLTYGLSQDGREDNSLLREASEGLKSWAFSEDAGLQERDLAPLCLCAYLITDEHDRELLAAKVIDKIKALLEKELTKFSLLNDPEQMFCIIVGGMQGHLSNAECEKLRELARRNSKTGGPVRRVLYTACLLELGVEPDTWDILNEEIGEPEGLVAVIWLHERYKERHGRSVTSLWKSLENMKETITVESVTTEEVPLIPLSNRAIAMLYEAVTQQTQKPDPDMLFDNYPLHPRVREITESLFKKEEYFNAVFEAVKAFNKFIQKETGLSESEIQLVLQAVGSPTAKETMNPKIRFNPLDSSSPDYKSQQNEQRGLSCLAHGIFLAFRHPKGHEPKDTRWIHIDPYEALDQLITISYMMKRIEEAKEK